MAVADVTCRAFDSAPHGDVDALHRFVVGADPAPVKLTRAEVRKLGDPFAELLLAKGKFPRNAEEVVDGIRAAVPKKHALKQFSSFVVGEGGTLPESARVERSLRFIVTLGGGPKGPDVFVSVGHPRQTDGIEVMAWKRGAGGFNFYRSGSGGMWMFAGNSRDALRPRSRGKGPFESHPSGSLLMKELKIPWQNWHSPEAIIPLTAFAKDDDRRRHPWFKDKDPGGAYTLEFAAARPAITRWAEKRFQPLRKGGAVPSPRLIMEQIVTTPTVNLVTTSTESRVLAPGMDLFLPAEFFFDVDGLLPLLGLNSGPVPIVPGKVYLRCLEKFDVHLEDGRFKRKGDTHFCFLVPERAFEDQEALRLAIEVGLVSKRLAACLLMVDPWNPVFSERRAALLEHAPAKATISGGKSDYSQRMADAILAAAKSGPAGTPEAEFAERWKVGARFQGPFRKLLRSYFDAVERQAKTQDGFEAYFKLAADRRREFKKKMPIAEFPLLLPATNIPNARRRMRRDGTVEER